MMLTAILRLVRLLGAAPVSGGLRIAWSALFLGLIVTIAKRWPETFRRPIT